MSTHTLLLAKMMERIFFSFPTLVGAGCEKKYVLWSDFPYPEYVLQNVLNTLNNQQERVREEQTPYAAGS